MHGLRTRPTKAGSFQRLKDLPNLHLVDARLKQGESPESVGRWLQENCGLCGDVKRGSLVRQLYRYRDSLPLTQRMPTKMAEIYRRTAELSHKVDVLEELQILYELQVQRVGEAIDFEAKTPTKISALAGREIDRAAYLLGQIREHKVLLGLLGPSGERNREDKDGEASANGAMAVLMQRHGPEAFDRMVAIGKLIEQRMRPLLAEGRTPVEVSAHVENGNGKEATS